MENRETAQRRGGRLPSPWTPAVLELLRDWDLRAAASAETHFDSAMRLSRRNVQLGIPVVALSTFVGTSVFATLQADVGTYLRILVGGISVSAAVLASLQTFLRFAERAERHRVAADNWSAIRREIAQMLALHPTYLASRGDPKQYLDDLRRRMDDVAAQAPEMPERRWARAREKHGIGEVDRPAAPTEANTA
ncbi:MAG: SLATT domain-containing protein [Actinomycetota bacterium]|nr:SLATT domain-containing protein [Actinomycetota bacterium]